MVKFDNLNIGKKVSFIKIDAEGHDFEVIQGFKKTIKKYKPVLLIEFNHENFTKITKRLDCYSPYIYNIDKNNFNKVNVNLINKKIDRSDPDNLLSVRNIYFFHQLFIKKCPNLFR